MASFLQSGLSVVPITLLLIMLGSILGHIKIKGVSLQAAGILIVAMIYGVVLNDFAQIQIGEQTITLYSDAIKSQYNLISSFGTVLFVTSVGYGAGEKFFRQLNKNYLSYLVVALITVLCAVVVFITIRLLNPQMDFALLVGLFAGGLTSTPGFSTAKEAAGSAAEAVTAGYGIAYLFGVLGVVLFVQLMPKILHADIEKEKEKLVAATTITVPPISAKTYVLDDYKISGFLIAAVTGIWIGSIKIPILGFSLGSSGGCLLTSLLMAHFGHIGPIDCRINKQTLHFLKELGLILFLAGCGVPGGVNFVRYAKLEYFFYGVLLTMIPMIVAFVIARRVFKMGLFNALGTVCGAMTSTPSLGALINTCGNDDVAATYSATYPVALCIIVVIVKAMFLI